MKEVKLGRYTGPYETVPYKTYVQSPIGLVPKAGGKTRLIFHLSYQFKQSGNLSINEYTPEEFCTVKYNDIDQAVKASFTWQNTCTGKVFYSKTDLESAFRILLVKRKCYKLLILKANHPITGKLYYFVEKNLSFGHSISCSLFQRFSNSLRHILEKVWDKPEVAINYLDDFLFMAPSSGECNALVNQFLHICQKINVPVALDKTEYATPVITFLGVVLNEAKFLLMIPEDKRLKALNWVLLMFNKKNSPVRAEVV